MHTHTHLYTHTTTRTPSLFHTHTYTGTISLTHTRTHQCAFVCLYVDVVMYVCRFLCGFVRVCTCACVRVCVRNIGVTDWEFTYCVLREGMCRDLLKIWLTYHSQIFARKPGLTLAPCVYAPCVRRAEDSKGCGEWGNQELEEYERHQEDDHSTRDIVGQNTGTHPQEDRHWFHSRAINQQSSKPVGFWCWSQRNLSRFVGPEFKTFLPRNV